MKSIEVTDFMIRQACDAYDLHHEEGRRADWFGMEAALKAALDTTAPPAQPAERMVEGIEPYLEPRVEANYGVEGRSYVVVFVQYREKQFVESVYQYVGGGRRHNTAAFRRKVWPIRNPASPVRHLLETIGADSKSGLITAAQQADR